MQFLIETDILRSFLTHSDASRPSVLRRCLSAGVCYTTMVNAMELFQEATTVGERDAAMHILSAVRVLGFNARYAEPFATLATEHPHLSEREVLVAGMASVSKLTIVTERYYESYNRNGKPGAVRAPEEVPEGAE